MEQAVEDYEDDVVDDDEETILEESTGCYCVQCTDEIRMVEEVFLLRVVQAFFTEGRLQHVDILDPAGNYVHEPAFFCFDCWEETQEELNDQMEDVPPMQHAAGFILCDICQSDVLQGETVGVLSFGEIHWSERSPNHEYSPVFVDMDNEEPKHICIGCLYHLEENRDHPLWPEGVEPIPGVTAPTIDDLFGRTWRTT